MKLKSKPLNNQGIAHIALILGVVILGVIIAGGFRVVQHNSANKSSVTSGQNKTDSKTKITDDTGALNKLSVSSPQTGGSAAGQAASPTTSSPTTSKTSAAPTAKASPIQGTQPSSNGTSSSNQPTIPDGDTPQVTLTYPSYWGQTVSGTITMTATASDSSGIQKIVFMIRRIGYATPVYTETDTSAPYSASFDTTTLPNGGSEYTVEAQVYDNASHSNLASHRINIQN